MRAYSPVLIAREFLYVREAQSVGQNRGLRVEAVQHWSGGAQADSWCMEMLWMWFDLAYQGKAPFGRMQACESLHALAKQQQWIVKEPGVGDIALTVNDAGHAHHVALVTGISPLTTIAGNTSSDGVSSNGDGVYEHQITPVGKVFVRVPV